MRRFPLLLATLALTVAAVPTAGAKPPPWAHGHKPKPAPAPTLTAPAGLSAGVGATTVELHWSSVDDDTTRLVVKRNGGALATLDPAARGYSDARVMPATAYSYSVVAYGAGRAAESRPVRVTLPAYKVGSVTRTGRLSAARPAPYATTE